MFIPIMPSSSYLVEFSLLSDFCSAKKLCVAYQSKSACSLSASLYYEWVISCVTKLNWLSLTRPSFDNTWKAKFNDCLSFSHRWQRLPIHRHLWGFARSSTECHLFSAVKHWYKMPMNKIIFELVEMLTKLPLSLGCPHRFVRNWCAPNIFRI